MKKTIVFLGLVIVVLSLFVNSKLGYQGDNKLSDNELIELYLLEERGNGNYDVFVNDGPDDEYIYYSAYDGGKFVDCGSVERGYCEFVVFNQE